MKMTHTQRMIQHEHNSHRGRIRLAISCARSISESRTVTPDCHAKANTARILLEEVDRLLVDRINEDKTISHLKWNDPPPPV